MKRVHHWSQGMVSKKKNGSGAGLRNRIRFATESA